MKKFLIILGILLFIIYIFFIEPNRLIIKNYTIQDPQLKGLKVVLVGD